MPVQLASRGHRRSASNAMPNRAACSGCFHASMKSTQPACVFPSGSRRESGHRLARMHWSAPIHETREGDVDRLRRNHSRAGFGRRVRRDRGSGGRQDGRSCVLVRPEREDERDGQHETGNQDQSSWCGHEVTAVQEVEARSSLLTTRRAADECARFLATGAQVGRDAEPAGEVFSWARDSGARADSR
jgi:hypothetical protein